MEEPNEGRLSNNFEEDDNLDETGIEPKEKKKIFVGTEWEFNNEQQKEWEEILKLAIIGRCSTGTNDIGEYSGEMYLAVKL